jgi:hypothetical protein
MSAAEVLGRSLRPAPPIDRHCRSMQDHRAVSRRAGKKMAEGRSTRYAIPASSSSWLAEMTECDAVRAPRSARRLKALMAWSGFRDVRPRRVTCC